MERGIDEEKPKNNVNNDILYRLKGKIKQRKFATIDIEATQWVNAYAVGFYDGKHYFDFIGDDCIQQALTFVLQDDYIGYWIYAHNGGNYDFTFFLRQLLRRNVLKKYKVEVTPIGSCMFRIDVFEWDKDFEKKRDGKLGVKHWVFIDSARLMPIKLDDLGETFGIGKKVSLNMSYDELAQENNRDIMRKYLKQDCVLLYKAVEKMQATINKMGGEIQSTLPSTSLDLFRRRYQRDDIYSNRHFISCPSYGEARKSSRFDKEKVCEGCGHEFIRNAYYGGRSEIFRMNFTPSKGHELAYLFDVNSMYPACMLNPMPIGQGTLLQDIDEDDLYRNAALRTGIVECDVEIPSSCYIPPLPWREKKGSKLIFPSGKFTGVWDTCELTLLREVGGKILKIRRSMWFDEETIFTRFVKNVYSFRNKKSPDWNAGLDWIAKILLNAAYGKFALKEERTRFHINPVSIEGLTPIDLESDIWSEEIKITPSYVVPQLAVHVTALARAMLWRIMNDVVKQGGRVYYCDTDSVVCSGIKLNTGGELGQLKLEHNITRAEFVLPKLYLIETEEANKKKKEEVNLKVKAKGMGPGIRVNNVGEDKLDGQLSEREFIDMVKKGIPIERTRLVKFREALNEYARKATEFPRLVSAPKQIQSEYDKRIVLKDFDTRSIVL